MNVEKKFTDNVDKIKSKLANVKINIAQPRSYTELAAAALLKGGISAVSFATTMYMGAKLDQISKDSSDSALSKNLRAGACFTLQLGSAITGVCAAAGATGNLLDLTMKPFELEDEKKAA